MQDGKKVGTLIAADNGKTAKLLPHVLLHFKERSLHAFQIKFKDRAAAGEILASSVLGRYKHKLKKNRAVTTTVIGVARGGIITADVVASKLSADDFDVVVPRKIGSPENPENAIGAVMQDGSVYLDAYLAESLKVENAYIESEISIQREEMQRRISLYRPEPREYKIRDRTVILVDDGAVTGATIVAAARWIRKRGPKRLIIALPVAPRKTVKLLENEADRVEVIMSPLNVKSLEQFYQSFSQVDDEQIINILRERNCSTMA